MTDNIQTPEVAPIIEIAAAVAKTISNPSPAILVEDLILVHRLVISVKGQLAGKHTDLMSIFSILLHGN